jgi:hypothetical protein
MPTAIKNTINPNNSTISLNQINQSHKKPINQPTHNQTNQSTYTYIDNHIKSIVVSTLGEDLGGSFLLSGPFIAGFGFVYFEGWPPKICFAFAIFNFSSGVISFFFYSGFPGGITVTGPFICGFSYF